MKLKKRGINFGFLAKVFAIILFGCIVLWIASGGITEGADSLFGFTKDKTETEVDKEEAAREAEIQKENREKAIDVFEKLQEKIVSCLQQNNYYGECASCGLVELELPSTYHIKLSRSDEGTNILGLYDADDNLVYPDTEDEIGNFFAIPEAIIDKYTDYKGNSYNIIFSRGKVQIEPPKNTLRTSKIYFKMPAQHSSLRGIEYSGQGISYKCDGCPRSMWFRYNKEENLWEWSISKTYESCWTYVPEIFVNDDCDERTKRGQKVQSDYQLTINYLARYNPIPPAYDPPSEESTAECRTSEVSDGQIIIITS